MTKDELKFHLPRIASNAAYGIASHGLKAIVIVRGDADDHAEPEFHIFTAGLGLTPETVALMMADAQRVLPKIVGEAPTPEGGSSNLS